MERSVELRHRDGLHVTASINEAEDLVISGQDLNPPPGFSDEYEYWVTVKRRDVPKVLDVLGGQPGDDVLALLAARGDEIVDQGEQRWLEGNGVPTAVSSWY